MPRYIVKTLPMAGDISKAMQAFNIQANCNCLITQSHSLHKHRQALNNYDTDSKAADLLMSLPESSANLLCTHIVETRTGIRKLRSLPFVKSVQIDEYCSIAEFKHDGTVNVNADNPDPLAHMQYVIELVQYDKAWSFTKGEGVKVGVVDTGIFPHIDLQENLIEGKNFTSEQDTIDLNGHGTHVAGSIACAINGKGIYGAAPKVKIAPIKVMGKGGGGFSTEISQGIIWAADNGFDVLNLSLGPYSIQFSKDAFDYAYDKGTLVIMASGNSGAELPETWGAAYHKNISVGNTNQADLRHSSSMYGDLVDVAAPGTKILSCGLSNSMYTTKTGTSMACPHVAALVALLVALAKSNSHQLILEEARDLIQEYGDIINTDKPVGNRINAINTVEAFLQYLEDGVYPEQPEPEVPEPETPEPEPETPEPEPETPEPPQTDVIELKPQYVNIAYTRQAQAILNYVEDSYQFSRNYKTYEAALQQLHAISSSSFKVTYNKLTGLIKTTSL